MSAQKPSKRLDLLNDYIDTSSLGKVPKRKYKGRMRTSLKRRDGLFNAAIPARSGLMQIAKRNCVSSSLLMLPAEIRNQIWKYVMGYHQINIYHHNYGRNFLNISAIEIRPLHMHSTPRSAFIQPKFQLQKVCRQVYVETSSMIYAMNTFGFNSYQSFDRWIRELYLGQKRLLTSIDIPYEYMRLYRNGTRKLFREKFPNIKRIGVDISVAYYTQRMENESLSMAKQRIVGLIKENEGNRIEVAWHTGTPASPVYR